MDTRTYERDLLGGILPEDSADTHLLHPTSVFHPPQIPFVSATSDNLHNPHRELNHQTTTDTYRYIYELSVNFPTMMLCTLFVALLAVQSVTAFAPLLQAQRVVSITARSASVTDVPIIVNGQNIELTPALIEHVQKRIGSTLNKLGGNSVRECDVVLSVNKNPKVKQCRFCSCFVSSCHSNVSYLMLFYVHSFLPISLCFQ
jgi:hypothetical protein